MPEAARRAFPVCSAVFNRYGDVIYSAAWIPHGDLEAANVVVRAYFDLYGRERGWAVRVSAQREADEFLSALLEHLFPTVTPADVNALLRERRSVVLQGSSGTGKTRMADEVRRDFFSARGRTVQFHPAVTYEDFIVGLSPDPSDAGLRFRTKPGWLLQAAAAAHDAPYLLIVDEINRGDLGKILGEAIYLFEPGEVGGSEAREVHLPHAVDGLTSFKLPPNLYVLGTMNTADRSIAGLDLAVRRRFAFVTLMPDPRVVDLPAARLVFDRLADVFVEHASDEMLHLHPGHSYFLAEDEHPPYLNLAGPAVSPDGKTVYAVGWPIDGELVTVDPETAKVSLAPPAVSGTWVTFSPDRRLITYVGYPEKTLWRAHADGSNKRALVTGQFENDGSNWSPDGRSIAFLSRLRGAALRIFVMPAEGGDPTPISDVDKSQGVPSWAPNGRRLVFGDVPADYGHPDGHEALWVHDLDARQTTELPGSRGRVLWTPRWSPDGHFIAAPEIRSPRQVHLYDTQTKTWRVLTSTGDVDDLQWTRDGRSLIYRTQGTNLGLAKVTVADGHVERLYELTKFTFAPNAYGWFGLTPDDQPMLLRNRGATEIYAIPVLR